MTDMTDCEMIEFAAKAAGYWDKEFDCYNGPFINWDPRNDDGDAFRLAAKLRLQVSFGTFKDDVAFAYQFGKQAVEVENTDIEAAAREAIFLAAVEIGKGMK